MSAETYKKLNVGDTKITLEAVAKIRRQQLISSERCYVLKSCVPSLEFDNRPERAAMVGLGSQARWSHPAT